MSLTSRLDGFEGRFLRRWVTAWIAMLLVNCVILQFFTWLETLEPPTPELAEEHFSVAAFEGLVYSIAFVLTPTIAWVVLKDAYPRPSLAAWVGWMTLAMVVFTAMFAITLVMFVPEDGTAPDIGIGAYVMAFAVDMSSKLGLILAFLMLSWRVGSSLAVTFLIITFVLALFGLSSSASEVIWTLQTYSSDADWNGIEWLEFLAWSVESSILGATSGIAIIYGNRWQVRDVDNQVFD